MTRIFILLLLSITSTFAQKKSREFDLILGFRKNFDTPRSKLISAGIAYPIPLSAYNAQISPFITLNSNLEIYAVNVGVTYDYFLTDDVKGLYLQGGLFYMIPNHSYKTLYPSANAKLGVGYRFKNYDKLVFNLEGSLTQISSYADYVQLSYLKAIRLHKFKNNLSNKCPYQK